MALACSTEPAMGGTNAPRENAHVGLEAEGLLERFQESLPETFVSLLLTPPFLYVEHPVFIPGIKWRKSTSEEKTLTCNLRAR